MIISAAHKSGPWRRELTTPDRHRQGRRNSDFRCIRKATIWKPVSCERVHRGDRQRSGPGPVGDGHRHRQDLHSVSDYLATLEGGSEKTHSVLADRNLLIDQTTLVSDFRLFAGKMAKNFDAGEIYRTRRWQVDRSDAGIGQPPSSRTHRKHPTGRGRDKFLCGFGKIRYGRVTKTNQPPANPGRVWMPPVWQVDF